MMKRSSSWCYDTKVANLSSETSTFQSITIPSSGSSLSISLPSPLQPFLSKSDYPEKKKVYILLKNFHPATKTAGEKASRKNKLLDFSLAIRFGFFFYSAFLIKDSSADSITCLSCRASVFLSCWFDKSLRCLRSTREHKLNFGRTSMACHCWYIAALSSSPETSAQVFSSVRYIFRLSSCTMEDKLIDRQKKHTPKGGRKKLWARERYVERCVWGDEMNISLILSLRLWHLKALPKLHNPT